jgi:hypothetical protein
VRNFPNGKHTVGTALADTNNNAPKYLDALFLALAHPVVNFYGIAYAYEGKEAG